MALDGSATRRLARTWRSALGAAALFSFAALTLGAPRAAEPTGHQAAIRDSFSGGTTDAASAANPSASTAVAPGPEVSPKPASGTQGAEATGRTTRPRAPRPELLRLDEPGGIVIAARPGGGGASNRFSFSFWDDSAATGAQRNPAAEITAGTIFYVRVTATTDGTTPYVGTPGSFSLSGTIFDDGPSCPACQGTGFGPTANDGPIQVRDWSGGSSVWRVRPYRAYPNPWTAAQALLKASATNFADATAGLTVVAKPELKSFALGVKRSNGPPVLVGQLVLNDVTAGVPQPAIVAYAVDPYGNVYQRYNWNDAEVSGFQSVSPGCAELACGTRLPQLSTTTGEATAATDGSYLYLPPITFYRASIWGPSGPVADTKIEVRDKNDPTIYNRSNTFVVAPGLELSAFTITSLKGQTDAQARTGTNEQLGTGNSITDGTAGIERQFYVRAYDGWGNIKWDYRGAPGNARLSGSALDAAPGCASGVCTRIGPLAGTVSTPVSPTTGDWSAGVGTYRVILTRSTWFDSSQDSARVTVTGLSRSFVSRAITSSNFVVRPNPTLAGLTVTQRDDLASHENSGGTQVKTTDDQTAGTEFHVRVWAYDAYGNVNIDYAGDVTSGGTWKLSSPGCDPGTCTGVATEASWSQRGGWSGGQREYKATAYRSTWFDSPTRVSAQIIVGANGVESTSATFIVRPAVTLHSITATTDVSTYTTSPSNPSGDRATQFETMDDQTAGTPFKVYVWAYDAYGNVNIDYADDVTSGGTWKLSSPGCNAGFCTGSAAGGTWTAVSDATDWTDGVRAYTATAYRSTWFDTTGTGTDKNRTATFSVTAETTTNTSATFRVRPKVALHSITATTNQITYVSGDGTDLDTQVETMADQTAGTEFTVYVWAYDQYGNVNIDYTGGVTSEGSWNDASPGCGAGVCTRSGTLSISSGTWTPVGGVTDWTDGVRAYHATAYRSTWFDSPSKVSATFNVTAETTTNTSATFTVRPKVALAGLTVTQRTDLASHENTGGTQIKTTDDQTAGTEFTVRVWAYDAYGNVNIDYAGDVTSGGTWKLSSPGCNPGTCTGVAIDASWSQTGGWSGGQREYKATAYRSTWFDSQLKSAQIVVGANGVESTSATFIVSPAVALDSISATTTQIPYSTSPTNPAADRAPQVEAMAEQTAGTPFPVYVWAYDAYGNVNKDYRGGVSASGDWDDASPGCVAGNCATYELTAYTGIWSAVTDASDWADGRRVYTATAYRSTWFDEADHSATASFTVTCGSCTTASNSSDLLSVRASPPARGLTVSTSNTSWASGASYASGPDKARSTTSQAGGTGNAIADQVAGVQLTLRVWAWDAYGNIADRFAGPARLSGSAFDRSPGCEACGTAVGSLGTTDSSSWTYGIGTFTATFRRANSAPVIEATAASFGATLRSTASSAFTINPNTATNLLFADANVGFTEGTSAIGFGSGQPIDGEKGSPVYRQCLPPPTTTGDPCATVTEIDFADKSVGWNDIWSPAVKVLAVDQFGNRRAGVSVTVSATSGDATGGTQYGTSVKETYGATAVDAAPYGEAAFYEGRISVPGTYRLIARAVGLPEATSATFRVVEDLVACSGATCSGSMLARDLSTGVNAFTDTQFVTPTTNATLTLLQALASGVTSSPYNGRNVMLTSTFDGGGPYVNDTCVRDLSGYTIVPGMTPGAGIGEGIDVRLTGDGIREATSNTYIVHIVPKSTLMSSGVLARGTATYNLCLGAIRVNGTTGGWTAKRWDKKRVRWIAKPTTADLTGYYWGIPDDCPKTTTPTSPCIAFRSKTRLDVDAFLRSKGIDPTRLVMSDSDLAMILYKPWPWDGKVRNF